MTGTLNHSNRLASYIHTCIHTYIIVRTYTSIYLGQLLSNVSPNKDSLQVDPQVLNHQPVLNDVRCIGQLLHP